MSQLQRTVVLMKAHIFISSGFLMAAIFFMRGMEVLNEPGLGWHEFYMVGGFIISGFLVHAGLNEGKAK